MLGESRPQFKRGTGQGQAGSVKGLMKKLDRRIARTRQLLYKALLNLSLDAGYEHISIRDIVSEAGVGYATFFRHFKSKDELFLSCLISVQDELWGQLDPNMTPYEEAVAIFHPQATARLLGRCDLAARSSSDLQGGGRPSGKDTGTLYRA